MEYAETLNDYARSCIEAERYSLVEEYLKKTIEIRKKQLGKFSTEYAESISNLGFYHSFTGKYKDSFILLNEAGGIQLKIRGEFSYEYADLKSLLGIYYLLTQDYVAAEKEYEHLIEISKIILTEDHPDYASALLSMSTLKANTGHYKEAENLIIKATAIIAAYYGKMHPGYAVAMSNLGNIYLATAKYEKGEAALQESLSLLRKLTGEKHHYYVNALNALALIYQKKGLYEQAEPLFSQSLQLRKDLYGEKHASVANATNNFGQFYLNMGNYNQAEQLLEKALVMTGETLGENSVDYGIRLTNLAELYRKKGDIDKALEVSEKSIPILRQSVGENHSHYLSALNALAILKTLYKQDDQAEAFFIEMKEKYLLIYGKNHPGHILAANNLAAYYNEINRLDEALDIFREILDIIDKESPLYLNICANIAYNFLYRSDIEKAQFYFEICFESIRNNIKTNFLFLSEQERFLFWESYRFFLRNFQSFVSQYSHEVPSLPGFAYDCELFSKSLLLNSSVQIEKSILNDEQLLRLWNDLRSLRDMVINYENGLINDLNVNNSLQLHEFLQNSGDEELVNISNFIYEKKEYVNQSEKDLFSHNKDYLRQNNEYTIHWKSIQQILADNEIAIEFIHFENVDFDKQIITDTLYYALLIRPNDTFPKTVFLGTQQTIETAIHHPDAPDNSSIYPVIWKPIEPFLKDVKHLFIAPTGFLCAVSFAGIKKENNYIGDHYTIHNLLSTKDIVGLKEQSESWQSSKQIVLFGGIDYMNSPIAGSNLNREVIDSSEKFSLNRDMLEYMDPLRGPGFTYLPGSKKEVQQISNYLAGLNWKAALFADKNATEERFKSLSTAQSPEVIHISTHGFYFPQPKQDRFSKEIQFSTDNKSNIYRLSDNPLMRSGLAFTGANHVWKGNDPIDGIDDGILTAYEISNLNLFNTELVVLSACNTGLGDIDHSEGVYGLQRAFRLAGVQTMIVSLWEVPDKETVELMTEFYSLWGKGLTKKEAFDKAQLKMRYTYPDQPEKWAGFVMIE